MKNWLHNIIHSDVIFALKISIMSVNRSKKRSHFSLMSYVEGILFNVLKICVQIKFDLYCIIQLVDYHIQVH